MPGGIGERLAECAASGALAGHSDTPRAYGSAGFGRDLASCLALAVEGTLPGAAQSPGPSCLGPMVLLWPGVTEWVHEDTSSV